MTTLTVVDRDVEDANPPPVPWRRIAWVIWRQHRVALIGLAAALVAIATYT